MILGVSRVFYTNFLWLFGFLIIWLFIIWFLRFFRFNESMFLGMMNVVMRMSRIMNINFFVIIWYLGLFWIVPWVSGIAYINFLTVT